MTSLHSVNLKTVRVPDRLLGEKGKERSFFMFLAEKVDKKIDKNILANSTQICDTYL
jgi:hypothetical protein